MPTFGHLLFAPAAFRAERLKPHETATLLVCSMLPDFDIVAAAVLHRPLFAFHREITHSMLFLSPFVLAWLLTRSRLAACAAFGVASHLALDVLDNGGIPLFAPWSWHPVALGLWRGAGLDHLDRFFWPDRFVADKLCLTLFLGWAAWVVIARTRPAPTLDRGSAAE